MFHWNSARGSVGAVLLLAATGCTKPSDPPQAARGEPAAKTVSSGDESGARPEGRSQPTRRSFTPVELGSQTASETEGSAAGRSEGDADEQQSFDRTLEAMQPLQILLGEWRGTTARKFNGFPGREELEWVWDFRSNRRQPGLVMTASQSHNLKQARLTWDPADGVYEMQATTADGRTKRLRGRFVQDPVETPEPGGRSQRSFKLELTQVDDDDPEPWQVVVNLQDNNRYVLEVNRRRGRGTFQRFDTVGTQRQGTSFAANDEDYKDRKCIVSGGLGTSQVRHEGKSYWVCCSGCRAAFEEDPQRWIDKAAPP